MQAAGTLRGGTRAIYYLLVLLVPLIGCAYSVPLQYLPSIPGYIPVYIRHGDEPLEDINPDLAEAFGETSDSAKSLQLDVRTLALADNFKDNDIDALLEAESKREHAYPLRVRAAESRSFASVDNDEPGNKNPNKPKLLTIYELPTDNANGRRRRRYRGRSRTRNENRKAPAAFKVSPLSDEEQEKLENLAIEKEEIQPNELSVPRRKRPRLPSEGRRNRHKARNFAAPVKVQNSLDETSTDLPDIPQIADIPKDSNGHNVTTPKAGKDEPSIKEKCNPHAILSNVDKISPIDLPDESEDNKDDKTKGSTEPNDEIAMD